jgi:hypothetical protein
VKIGEGIMKPCDGIPDAIVVMMNPGSSRPLDRDYRTQVVSIEEVGSGGWKELIPTRPDNAQYQIMRVMLSQRWNHVRVLNLSDLRNGNSDNFRKDFSSVSDLSDCYPHSIFTEKRKAELHDRMRLNEGGFFILAWGSMKILKPLARKALAAAKGYLTVGVKVDGCNTSFRFASPYRKDHKLRWLQEIKKRLEKHSCAVRQTC